MIFFSEQLTVGICCMSLIPSGWILVWQSPRLSTSASSTDIQSNFLWLQGGGFYSLLRSVLQER